MLVVGLGRMGRTIVRSFGDQVAGVVTSRPQEGRREFPELNPDSFYDLLAAVPIREYDVLWLAVPDRAIPDVAAQLAEMLEDWSGKIVVHTSGATSIAPLVPFRERGAAVAVLHPNAILSGDEPFPRALVWGITLDGFAKSDAEQLLAAFDPKLIEVSDEFRPLYHAAASVAANYSMVLFAAAVQLYRQAGVAQEFAEEIVARFMWEGVRVSVDEGFAEGLTGPVARGDTGTVEGHLAAVRQYAPELHPLIAELVRTATHMMQVSSGK